MSVSSEKELLYMKVVNQLKMDLKTRVLPPDMKLPSEPELAKKLGVSRTTLREALVILESENIVKRVHGKGTYVRGQALIESGIEELSSISELIIQNGKEPGTSMYTQETVNASEEERTRFKLKSGEKVKAIRRIRTADGDPVVYCKDTLPASLFGKNHQFSDESLFSDLENAAGIEVDYAVSKIKSRGYVPEVSDALNCTGDMSLLVLSQMHFDTKNRPVLYSINYFRSDLFSFTVLRTKK
ncbi:GntR family transcriptional regulator [Alteribacter natronophilus]|uniref:GntR family transcriptional regulator n=1 Tax=Alteribacter natronophilus TaxID=2583810 RepID=UPI0014868D41|nr:GntR family transcriptional regulator [Alteribacter natronophilus]